MQIDLSTLSEAQKKFYVQLLAQSNLNFTKKDNQFIAQFKVDPKSLHQSKLISPGIAEHSGVLTVQSTNKSKPLNQTKKVDGIHIPNKKPLNKVVKVGQLSKFQTIHPYTEIYVYPKRMSAFNLEETIEVIYQKFWQQHKRKSSELKHISLPEWVYHNIICSVKDKLKLEQRLLNFLDGVNYYQFKIQGVKLFHNFLAEKWPIDSFLYFLVLRGLLEQVINDKILEKCHGNQTKNGYNLRSSPYDKSVTEEQVSQFLAILQSEGLFCSKSRPKPFEVIFQQLTSKMYFDEHKKRNYIYFYELLQQMVLEFMENDVSSCDMSLSKTDLANEDESLSQLITGEPVPHHEPHRGTKDYEKKQQTYNYSVSLDPIDQQLFVQRQIQEREQDIKQELKNMVLDRANEIYSKLGIKMTESGLEVIMTAFRAVTQLDKHLWISFRGQVSDAELLAIEKLQEMFRQREEPYLLTKLVKNLFLLPIVREIITRDIRL